MDYLYSGRAVSDRSAHRMLPPLGRRSGHASDRRPLRGVPAGELLLDLLGRERTQRLGLVREDQQVLVGAADLDHGATPAGEPDHLREAGVREVSAIVLLDDDDLVAGEVGGPRASRSRSHGLSWISHFVCRDTSIYTKKLFLSSYKQEHLTKKKNFYIVWPSHLGAISR